MNAIGYAIVVFVIICVYTLHGNYEYKNIMAKFFWPLFLALGILLIMWR